jgi:hypothetical protein
VLQRQRSLRHHLSPAAAPTITINPLAPLTPRRGRHRRRRRRSDRHARTCLRHQASSTNPISSITLSDHSSPHIPHLPPTTYHAVLELLRFSRRGSDTARPLVIDFSTCPHSHSHSHSHTPIHLPFPHVLVEPLSSVFIFVSDPRVRSLPSFHLHFHPTTRRPGFSTSTVHPDL